jgi:hypothetical protein
MSNKRSALNVYNPSDGSKRTKLSLGDNGTTLIETESNLHFSNQSGLVRFEAGGDWEVDTTENGGDIRLLSGSATGVTINDGTAEGTVQLAGTKIKRADDFLGSDTESLADIKTLINTNAMNISVALSNSDANIATNASNIATQTTRIDNILQGADASLDTFLEIKTFVEELGEAGGAVTALVNRVTALEDVLNTLTSNS